MRITHRTLTDHVVGNIQRNLEQLDRFNSQLSSGKRIRVPSDDPVRAASSMRLRTALYENERYRRNADDAHSWLSATDSALGDVGQVVLRARELAVYGARGDHTAESREALAQEMDQLLRHVVQVGNSTQGGRYLFGGQETIQAPFSGDPPVYNGDANPIEREVGPGIRVRINVTGDVALMPVVEALQRLRDDLRLGDVEAVSGSDLQALDAAHDTLLQARAQVGAQMNGLELTSNRLEDLRVNLTDLLSRDEDVDVAQTIMELKMQENVHRLSLAVGARILQPTLLDFLR